MQQKEVIVRRATGADLAQLLLLEQEIIKAERPFDATIREKNAHYYDLEAILSNPKCCLLVGEADNTIVATGYARIEAAKPYAKHKEQAYLGFMFVQPLFRGQGINSRIMEELEQFAAANGITELRLEVYAENESAIKAYEKTGFRNLIVQMQKTISSGIKK